MISKWQWTNLTFNCKGILVSGKMRNDFKLAINELTICVFHVIFFKKFLFLFLMSIKTSNNAYLIFCIYFPLNLSSFFKITLILLFSPAFFFVLFFLLFRVFLIVRCHHVYIGPLILLNRNLSRFLNYTFIAHFYVFVCFFLSVYL